MSSQETVYPFTNLADFLLSNASGTLTESQVVYIDATTGESITYAYLKHLVACVHAGLKRLGFKKGDSVCSYMPNHVYMAPLYVGTIAAGCTISPANTAYVATELQRQLEISEAKLLVAHPKNLDIALEAAALAGLPRSRVLSIVRDPAGRVPLWRDVLVDEAHKITESEKLTHEESKSLPAYLCFSSGTTGKSKGVMTSHRNCIAMILEILKALPVTDEPKPKKTVLAVIPMYHFAGIHHMINASLFGGSTVVILEKYSVEGTCKAIQDYKVTDFPTAPPILLHLINNPVVDKYDLSSLTGISVGSAPVSRETVLRVAEKFGVPCLNGYGMTETSPGITFQTLDTYKPGSVGRIVPCMEAKFVDADGNEVPRGEPGELLVRGPNIMIGYKGDADSTANAIDKDGWLHTGDICRMDEEGNVFIVDRIKELIKYKGFQVAPVELEAVLLRCPLVIDAGVIGIYDEKQATELPRAYVVLAPNVTDSEEIATRKIAEWVNSQVASHKQLRGGVKVTKFIPKSEAGKILRKELQNIYKKEQSNTPAKL